MKKKFMKFISNNFSMAHGSDSSSDNDGFDDCFHQKVGNISDLEEENKGREGITVREQAIRNK